MSSSRRDCLSPSAPFDNHSAVSWRLNLDPNLVPLDTASTIWNINHQQYPVDQYVPINGNVSDPSKYYRQLEGHGSGLEDIGDAPFGQIASVFNEFPPCSNNDWGYVDNSDSLTSSTGIKNSELTDWSTPPAPAPIKACSCMVCQKIGQFDYYDVEGLCRFPGCNHKSDSYHLPLKHEREHFVEKGHYRCGEAQCEKVFKRWYDVPRHYKVNHCQNAKRFPCNVVGCKYSGDDGFLRKDKLKSHYRNVHLGRNS